MLLLSSRCTGTRMQSCRDRAQTAVETAVGKDKARWGYSSLVLEPLRARGTEARYTTRGNQ